MSQAEYVRTLLLGICSTESLDDNPINRVSDESMKSYFTGKRDIGSLAAKIIPYLDPEQLEPFFKKLGFDAEMELYKDLSPYCPSMTDQNVAEEAPRLLVRILTAASSGRRGNGKSISQTQQNDILAYVQETNCCCALCGRKLIKMTSKGTSYTCDVVKITPSSLSSLEINDFAKEGVVLPEPGSADDFIALCPNCSKEYQASFDKNSVKRLLGIKQSLQRRALAAARLGECDLDEEIEGVLKNLYTLVPEETEANLRLDALALKDKIADSEPLLRDRIRTDVARYYRFIEDSLGRLSEDSGFGFDRTIAAQVQIAYLTASSAGGDQSDVYEALVDWLNDKAPACKRTACEIVISFFVQNCEVFDEITR